MALLTQLERAIIQKRQAVSMPLDPKLLSHMLPAHSMMPPFDPASFNMLLANSWANSGFPCPGVARPVQSPPANDQNTSTESNSSDAHQPAVSAQPLTRERIGSSSNQELNDVGKSGRPRVMADTSKPSISGAGSALANQKSRTQQDSAKPAQHEGATNAFVNAAKPEMRRIASEPSVGRHTGHHGSDVMRGGSPPLPGDAAGDQQQGGGKPARGGKAEPTFVLAEEDFPTLGNPATAAAQPRFPAGRPKFGDVAAKALTAGQTGGPAAGKAQMGQSQPSSSLAGGSPPISSNSEAQDIEDQPQPAPEVQGGMQLNEER